MPKQSSLFPEDNYKTLLGNLKQRIQEAQLKVALSATQTGVYLYWQIGQEILVQQKEQGWGSKVIDRLSKDLKREFPNMRGFSPRNLKYMRTFAATYPNEEVVLQTIANIPWGHNQTLLNKLDDMEQRLWYAQQSSEYGWSRSVLEMQIETNLFKRQGGAITNFERTLPPSNSDLSQQLLKDPYNLDFFSLARNAQERDLENALVNHIKDFLLELGVGFAFVGSQYRLDVEGDEYFLDLLLYHLKLHCYVVIDLKMTEFKPEYAGKMNFYVTAVNHLLKDERDDPTIGIVLCRSKKRTVVEFALNTVHNPIGVATYKLREDLPPALRKSLPSAEQLEFELEKAAQALESTQE